MKVSFCRRSALTLARWAARVLPPDDAAWGEAMRSEVEHIDDAHAALRWAAGALWAASLHGTGSLLNNRWAGRGLAFVALLQALGMFFAPGLIIAWRLRWLRMYEFLGGQLPGDHYERFVPLMNATSAWQLALWVAVGVLFLIVAYRLLHNRHGAFTLFVTAVLLAYASTCAGWMDRQLDPALADIYRHTFTFPRPSFRRDYLLPAARQALPLLMAAILWWREKRAVHSAS